MTETTMTRVTILAAGAALALLGSAAFADPSFTGTVSVLDRTTNEIVLKPLPAGETTGASPAGAQTFRMKGAIPETLHAGDQVTVSYSEAGGVKTISDLAKPK
jgi:DNA-binding beta-propeller fold protein YncE